MPDGHQHDPVERLIAQLSGVDDVEARVRIAREVLVAAYSQGAIVAIQQIPDQWGSLMEEVAELKRLARESLEARTRMCELRREVQDLQRRVSNEKWPEDAASVAEHGLADLAARFPPDPG